MSKAALQDKRGATFESCRSDLLSKIFWIKERYDSVERDYLDEIDQQVRRYTRATTQKIENLTNRDQNVRGNLNYLLSALSRNRKADNLLEQIQSGVQLYEQSFLSEKSLWYRKHPGKRQMSDPIFIEDQSIDEESRTLAEALLHSEYGKAAVAEFMEKQLGAEGICFSKDLNLENDRAYIMSLLTVLGSSDTGAAYSAEELGGNFAENSYTIPQLKFVRKEERK